MEGTKEPMTEIIEPALIVGMSAAFLWVFWEIWLRGSYYMHEPNRLVLTAEILMMVTILVPISRVHSMRPS